MDQPTTSEMDSNTSVTSMTNASTSDPTGSDPSTSVMSMTDSSTTLTGTSSSTGESVDSTSTGDESTSTGTPAECGNGEFEAGDLCFSETTNVDTVNPVSDLALADMDGNGTLDLVTAETNDGEAAFYFGSGTGTFGGYSGDAFSPGADDVAVGDFNDDGDADSVYALASDVTIIGVMLGDGAGTFALPFDNYSTGAQGGSTIATGFINDDSRTDVVVLGNNASGNQPVFAAFIANANGTFTNPVLSNTINAQQNDILLADFNANGVTDAAYSYGMGGNARIRVCRGNGTGAFANCETLDPGGTAPTIAAGDFDGDGNMDVAASSSGVPRVQIFAGMGNGAFADPMDVSLDGASFGLTASDLNGDGVDDLVATQIAADAVGKIILGGSFDVVELPAVSEAAGCEPLDVRTGDFNGDSAPDVAVACSGEDRVVIFNSDV